MTTTDYRIYVASLTDYSNGILHGRWIDITDVDSVWDEINAMLAESPTAKETGCPAEEWAIHDYEFGPVHLSEHESIEELVAMAEAAEEHGEAFLAWVSHEPRHNRDPHDFENSFQGEWTSLEEYVIDWWEQTGGLPKADFWAHPLNYIAWDRLSQDWEINGDVFTIDSPNGVYVFSNR